MNRQQNPFAEPDPVLGNRRQKHVLRTLALILLLVMLGGAGVALYQQNETLKLVRAELEQSRAAERRSQEEVADLQKTLTSAESEVGKLNEQLANSTSTAGDLRKKLALSQAQVADLEKEKEAVVQTHKGLADQMRAELESKDVTISQLQGKLTVNILDRILFDSGEAVLKAAGEAVLQQIAGILEKHPTVQIHVIGHTDNVPIRAGGRSPFVDNWDLSMARALAAVRFLTEKAGVDPRRLGAVGYGEFRPVADNNTVEGRGKNRRIAVTILADELAGVDTVTSLNTNPVSPAATPTETSARN